MTTIEAPPEHEPLMPTDPEIMGMKKAGLLKVIRSHGLPATVKMTAEELRPWAVAVVHGARGAQMGTGTPESEGEPVEGPSPGSDQDAPVIQDVPVDAEAVEHVEMPELEPVGYRAEIIPDLQVWARIEAMAKYMFKSSLRPTYLKNEHDVGLILLAAYDLGVKPSFAMQKIHVQNGRFGMQGELMSALILRDGHELRPDVANDDTVARAWGRRKGTDEWVWAEFTIDKAVDAGLCYRDADGAIRARSKEGGKLPWELYTADMLYWRALARLARRHFSDCLGGISYTPDELGWAIDADAADMLDAAPGDRPFGRAGEPEPTMTIGRQRSELQNALAELPTDLQDVIKADWAARNFPPVRDLSAAAIRVVRGWLEAAEAEVERREQEATKDIPEAEVVAEHDGGAPVAAPTGEGGESGSAAADRDAPEPDPAEDRQEAGEPDRDAEGPVRDVGAVSPSSESSAPDAASPAPDGPRGGLFVEDVGPLCVGCHEEIRHGMGVVETDDGPYHEDCAPM